MIAAIAVLTITVVRAVFYSPQEEIDYVNTQPTEVIYEPEATAITAVSAIGVPNGVTPVETVPKPAPVKVPAKPVISLEKYPSRLVIPTLGVDANVQETGVKPDGNMANPTNFTDVGWYKYGTAPGFTGSAVMAGHVNNGLGLKGVFTRLDEIQVGAELVVRAKDGTESRFRVVRKELYAYTSAPPAELFHKSDGTYLNLITCTGIWIPEKKTYEKRLVVYTELVK